MRITNRRAPYDYQLLDRIEAGISLSGNEVKSIKSGRLDLSSGFVRIKDEEAYLINVNIPPYIGGAPRGYNPTRDRKLLLNKKELVALETKTKQQELTIVPVSVYTKGRLIKVEIALARSKRKYEKRAAIRARDIARETERELKG